MTQHAIRQQAIRQLSPKNKYCNYQLQCREVFSPFNLHNNILDFLFLEVANLLNHHYIPWKQKQENIHIIFKRSQLGNVQSAWNRQPLTRSKQQWPWASWNYNGIFETTTLWTTWSWKAISNTMFTQENRLLKSSKITFPRLDQWLCGNKRCWTKIQTDPSPNCWWYFRWHTI